MNDLNLTIIRLFVVFLLSSHETSSSGDRCSVSRQRYQIRWLFRNDGFSESEMLFPEVLAGGDGGALENEEAAVLYCGIGVVFEEIFEGEAREPASLVHAPMQRFHARHPLEHRLFRGEMQCFLEIAVHHGSLRLHGPSLERVILLLCILMFINVCYQKVLNPLPNESVFGCFSCAYAHR